MSTTAKQVLNYPAGLLERLPLVTKEFLHLGAPSDVDQVRWRLIKRGTLVRVGRGILYYRSKIASVSMCLRQHKNIYTTEYELC